MGADFRGDPASALIPIEVRTVEFYGDQIMAAFANKSRRDTADDCIGRNILCNYRASGNHGTATDASWAALYHRPA